MSIRRACSYNATIELPEAPSHYSKILVSFGQDGDILINKDESELVITETDVTVRLTQAETKSFTAGMLAFLQVRCYASTYDAPGSACWQLWVEPAINDTVLSDEVQS